VGELSNRARHDLDGLPEALRKKAQAIIDSLDTDPNQGKKLKGKLQGKRSVRLGRTHRIIYLTNPGVFVLTVVRRRDAYR
jgi:mRNA-degrading endonuclease RelE of RelBE toxin-antitoxin system